MFFRRIDLVTFISRKALASVVFTFGSEKGAGTNSAQHPSGHLAIGS
jgi:hypothetical protein